MSEIDKMLKEEDKQRFKSISYEIQDLASALISEVSQSSSYKPYLDEKLSIIETDIKILRNIISQ